MDETNEIHTLIDKTIAPPGIQKKNKQSIFKTIGDVGTKIKKDALKAFNAHFPYIADEKKLEEHGHALLIPHLLHDSAEEYRNRVATASFFLSKAGERGYILSQLEAHFGSRYVLSESFLNVYIKVLDISEGDRLWVRQFLDELLNPVIRLTFGDWMQYIEQLPFMDKDEKCVKRKEIDPFSRNTVFRDGRVLRDGLTVLSTQVVSLLHDGSKKRNAALMRKSFYRVSADGVVDVPIHHNSGIRDILSLNFIRTDEERWEWSATHDVLHFDRVSQSLLEEFSIRDAETMRVKMNTIDRLSLSDSVSLSATAEVAVTDTWHLTDSFFCGKKYARFRNGQLFHNGCETRKSNVLIAL